MKWRLIEAKNVAGYGMGRGELPEFVLDEVRPGDSLCILINNTSSMWCKVIFRVIDRSWFVCSVSYDIPHFGLQAKQKIIVRGSQVINILAGVDHRKSWNRYNEVG